MANTYTWDISLIQCRPEVGIMTNYVVSVNWSLNGTNGTWTTAPIVGSVDFTVNPDKPDYTPFDELTKEQVLGWVQASIGAENIAVYEVNIDADLFNQSNPFIVFPGFPWAK